MALKPTIISPGIELVEIDESVRASVPAGTTMVIYGFAPMGPVDEVTSLSSMEDFISIYGYPTTPAERYFYVTVEQTMRSASSVLVSRLPYGADLGDTKSALYTILAYPALGFALNANKNRDDPDGTITYSFKPIDKFTEGSTVKSYQGTDTDEAASQECALDSATFVIGEPTQYNISLEQYYKFLNGQAIHSDAEAGEEFVWDENISQTKIAPSIENLGKYAFLVLNVSNSVTNDSYEGFYIGMSDNSITDPTVNYESVVRLKTVSKLPTTNDDGLTGGDYTTIPTERLDFKLSSTSKGSVSQILRESITDHDITPTQWNDTLNVGIFKVREATGTGDATKLAALITSGYNASLEYGRKTTSKYSTTAVDFYIENTSKNGGPVHFYVNPYLSGALESRGLYANGAPKIKVRVYTKQMHNALANIDLTGVTDVTQIMANQIGLDKTAATTLAGDVLASADALYPIGLYAKSNNAAKLIGNVPAKIKNCLALIENEELYNVDVILEGGLGTVYVGAMDAARKAYAELSADQQQALTPAEQEGEYVSAATHFDDTKIIAGVTNMRTSATLGEDSDKVVADFKAVHDAFLTLACSQQDGGRGDVFFIADGLRHIQIEGKDNKIEKQYRMPLYNTTYDEEYHTQNGTVTHSFSTSIYWPLRHLFAETISSFMAVYPQFIKFMDPQTGVYYWGPSSGCVGQRLAATDSTYGPWQAAAGTTNGLLTGTYDIGYTTNQRQRDDLYKISLNTIIDSPVTGRTIWGIRTMIKKDSSFDQITCRRTFLYIAKVLRDTAKQFLFEGNTAYTRLRVESTLNPVFKEMVNQRALYSYVLICDSRNNTAEVIDEGNMQIDFYGSPVRTAERILIGIHATRSGTIVTEYDA